MRLSEKSNGKNTLERRGQWQNNILLCPNSVFVIINYRYNYVRYIVQFRSKCITRNVIIYTLYQFITDWFYCFPPFCLFRPILDLLPPPCQDIQVPLTSWHGGGVMGFIFPFLTRGRNFVPTVSQDHFRAGVAWAHARDVRSDAVHVHDVTTLRDCSRIGGSGQGFHLPEHWGNHVMAVAAALQWSCWKVEGHTCV